MLLRSLVGDSVPEPRLATVIRTRIWNQPLTDSAGSRTSAKKLGPNARARTTETDAAQLRIMTSPRRSVAFARSTNQAASRGRTSAGASCVRQVAHVRARFVATRSSRAWWRSSASSRSRLGAVPKYTSSGVRP